MKHRSRSAGFYKDGSRHFMEMRQTGNALPRPARIQIHKWYWEDVGGVKGWETVRIYHNIFHDWDYADAVFDEILRRADKKKAGESE